MFFWGVIIALLINNATFGSQVVNTTRYGDDFDNCLFVGDSYTQMMSYYFGSGINWEGHEGYTVEKLGLYMDNVEKSNKENIIFFIGPNDYLRQIDTDSFYYTLQSYIRRLKANTNSRIFFCSYLDFLYNEETFKLEKRKYPLDEYDTMIQCLCQNEGIIYINLWDIADVNKMRGLSDKEGEGDKFHYGKAFYEEFFVHIKNDIKNQKMKEIEFIEKLKIKDNVVVETGVIVQRPKEEDVIDPELIAANLTKKPQ